MRYTLLENAVISLDIAVSHFKKFYYVSELSEEEYYIAAKVSLVFLENAIELLLKSLIVKNQEFEIYTKKFKDKNMDTLLKAKEISENNGVKLEDVLISNLNVKTIGYQDAVKYYYDNYCDSKKVNSVLTRLGHLRNSITHFGIDITNADEELICCIIETFDVIYNYLYSELIKLDSSASYYFTEDDFIVKTPYGYKFFLDENYIYNNFIDFVDELLLEDAPSYVMNLCYKNKARKIKKFIYIMNKINRDEEFRCLLKEKSITMEKYDSPWYVLMDEDLLLSPRYSSFYNATVYKKNDNEILFVIAHSEDKIYLYHSSCSYPYYDEPELDEQWIIDKENNCCDIMELTRDNIYKILKGYILSI